MRGGTTGSCGEGCELSNEELTAPEEESGSTVPNASISCSVLTAPLLESSRDNVGN